jgi:hypothetical protein
LSVLKKPVSFAADRRALEVQRKLLITARLAGRWIIFHCMIDRTLASKTHRKDHLMQHQS